LKYLVILFLLSAVLYAQCPLGLTPGEACPVDDARCTLFTDSNGDDLCDNPGPQSVPEEIEELEEVTEPDTIDTIVEEPVEEPELEEQPFCPLGLSPDQACTEDNARCTLYSDINSDVLCDNPGPQPITVIDPVIEEVEIVEEIPEEQPELPQTDDTLQILPLDTILLEEVSDTLVVTADSVQTTSCPLRLNLDEACPVDDAKCTLFVDVNSDEICDNPGLSGTVSEVGNTTFDENQNTQERAVVTGCPYGLPPEAACNDSLALCPHWFGVASNTACANPAGGSRKINIIAFTLAILLVISTWVSRTLPGKSAKNRARRNTTHLVIRGVSLMILGFAVQGCYCPLGTFQYAFAPGGLAFLGITGFVILLLPIVFSACFGRIYCGWVCPMGALQEFLYKIHAPHQFSPKGKFHNVLRHLKTVIFIFLVSRLLLNSFGISTLSWRAPFCSIDPFHTIFTLFLSGSLVVAGITIILAIFIRRFFCKYLCFYGVALSLFARLALWNKCKGSKECVVVQEDSDKEFDQ